MATVIQRPAEQKKQQKKQAPKTAKKPNASPEREYELNWPILTWIVLTHGGLLLAPFTFSWSGLAIVLVMHWLTGGVGICLGYHRLLTHGSFQTYRPVRWALAMVGSLAGEGPAVDWVADHRKHHAHSDQDGDPHSPTEGSWWSHIGWLVFAIRGRNYEQHVQRWAPDLANDRAMQIIRYLFLPTHIAFGLFLAAVGYAVGGWYLAASWVVWGMAVRMTAVLHSTWFVNSASHIWGYRNYETTDQSRNNWWVALITYGEGWHNNHHAYPRMAPHGHRWWEIDVTFRTIRLMQLFGLAWNVVDYKRKGDQDARRDLSVTPEHDTAKSESAESSAA